MLRVAALTLFLFLVALPLATARNAAADDGWGHLTGQILVRGDAPAPRKLNVDKDQAFCLREGAELLDQSLTVGSHGELSDAYVMMYFERGSQRPAVHPSYEQASGEKLVLDNHDCRFEPRALFLRTGQTLTMKNSDDVGHNCHIVTMGNEKNANLPAHSEVDVVFNESDRLPGEVKCDIHKWMSAVVLIREEPYAAITDSDGRFRIENIPAGQWTFQFWHRRAGYMRSLSRDGSEFLGRRGELTITIEPDQTLDLGQLVFPASDFKDN